MDYNPALGDLLVKGEFIDATAKRAVFHMENGADLSVFGSGFKYSKGVLNGGTIASVIVGRRRRPSDAGGRRASPVRQQLPRRVHTLTGNAGANTFNGGEGTDIGGAAIP